jgi:AhpD family alkylhydroperoxidase
MKNNKLYPELTREISEKRTSLSPEISEAWRSFSKTVFKEGALSEKTKQLIAVAVAHVTQCPYCIHGHTAQAMRKRASEKEIMEAIWVATEMRAGGSYAHSALAIYEMESKESAI